MTWFDEALYSGQHDQGYTQRLQVQRIIHQGRTRFQDLTIFENPSFGRVLVLDGIVQTTEGDEFIYHEMMAHVPLLAHGRVHEVLIIGGGDGGVLREVLRHPIERATMVELDREVIDLCRVHMPALSGGAFDDSRTDLMISDGVRFVAETDRRFDAIIVDSTDPIGPGAVLFQQSFYEDCRARLAPGGVVVTQNGVPIFQAQEVTDTWRRLGRVFTDRWFYTTPVPTYVGGLMTLAWASDDPGLRQVSADVLARRQRDIGLETRYYTPHVHVGAFALPPYITRLMT